MRFNEVVKKVKKLHPGAGDLVVVTATDAYSKAAEDLCAGLARAHPLSQVAIIPVGVTIQDLDTETMRDLGWVRCAVKPAPVPDGPKVENAE